MKKKRRERGKEGKRREEGKQKQKPIGRIWEDLFGAQTIRSYGNMALTQLYSNFSRKMGTGIFI